MLVITLGCNSLSTTLRDVRGTAARGAMVVDLVGKMSDRRVVTRGMKIGRLLPTIVGITSRGRRSNCRFSPRAAVKVFFNRLATPCSDSHVETVRRLFGSAKVRFQTARCTERRV